MPGFIRPRQVPLSLEPSEFGSTVTFTGNERGIGGIGGKYGGELSFKSN